MKSATLMGFEETIQTWGWSSRISYPTVPLYSANRGLCKGLWMQISELCDEPSTTANRS